MAVCMGSGKGMEQRAAFRSALEYALVLDENGDYETIFADRSEWLSQFEADDRCMVVSFLEAMSVLVVRSYGSFDEGRMQAIGKSMHAFVKLLKEENLTGEDLSGMKQEKISEALTGKQRVVDAWNEMWYLIIPREDDETTEEPGR